MCKTKMTETILAAKKAKGVTFADIGEAVGCDKVWVASVIYGQSSMLPDQAAALGKYLGLDEETAAATTDFPMKGSLDATVPADPLIYRFHEIMQVYGTTMKAVIHEMFGDGIMSAIDFSITIDKEEHPKGDRVVVTYNGKFLPYKKW
ncbi:MAG: cyanase [Phycisphaera sp.]|nr:cyanase [Phycisphaera sp.]